MPPKKAAPFDSSKFVKIVVRDGFEFMLDEKYALVSKKFKMEIEKQREQKATSENKELVLYEEKISKNLMEEAIKYFHYKIRYDQDTARPEFQMSQNETLSLLVVSKYLEC